MIANLLGRSIVLHLTAGHHADIRVTHDLVAKAGPLRRLIADRAYHADKLRDALRAADAQPFIPGRRNCTTPIRHDRRRISEGWRIEATTCQLKDFRHVATRHDKLARTFLDAVTQATIHAFWL